MSFALSEDLPYPSLDNLAEDAQTLRLLSPAYAGSEGELTAILLYVYQSIVFEKLGMQDYADTLKRIAVSEMHHLDLLGSAIIRLGAKPVYASPLPCAGRYYSADCVNYTAAPQTMLLADIRGERTAIREYGHILKNSKNAEISALVSRILLDEELHLKTFCGLYTKLNEKTD